MTNSRIQIEPTFAPKITSAPRNQKNHVLVMQIHDVINIYVLMTV